jgi:hypothetical protein
VTALVAMPRSRGSRLLPLVFVGLLIAACSPAASGAPSTSEAPAATPTSAPSPSPNPSSSTASNPSDAPSASAAADPALGLKIAAPYQLVALDPALEASFRQQFATSAGAFASLIGIGGREVTSGGLLAGYVFVIAFPAGVLTDASYQAMLGGIATGSQLTFTATTISGVSFSSGTTATSGLGAFRVGDHVVMVVAPTATTLTPIATALITANK